MAILFFCLHFVTMATPFAPWKIQIAYLNSPILKTLSYMQKCLHILYKTKICANLSKFGCHGNSLCPLENLDSILITKKISSVLVQNWIQSILADFDFFLKIPIVYLNSPTLETLLLTQKILKILYGTEMCAISANFCLHLVAISYLLPENFR